MSDQVVITPARLADLLGYRMRRERDYRVREIVSKGSIGLLDFTRLLFVGYEPAAHHETIAEHLEAIERGDLDRLIVVMPPRHGKSTLVSEHFPPWYLGRNPDKRIIACSHTTTLSNTFSRRARNKMTDPRWPFAGVTTAGDLRNVQRWDIAGRRGGYISAGVGSAISGMGADCLVLDDPVKSAAEADSQVVRDATWEWFTADALTRIEPRGACIVVGTRWHEDDLIGRLLSGSDAARWTVLSMPALSADERDALWPERFPVSALEAIRAQIGSRHFAALYQGRPSPAEGGTFKRHWWRFYRSHDRPALEAFDKIVQSWDMTFKETRAGSFVVGQVWGKIVADCYLLGQFRERVDFPGSLAAMRAMHEAWPLTREKLVEDKANGPAVVATLKGEIPGLIEVSPQGGKEARANAVTWLVEAGNVYIPDPMEVPWVEGFVEEAAAFPFAANDDQVDAMTQALVRLAGPASSWSDLDDASAAGWRALAMGGV